MKICDIIGVISNLLIFDSQNPNLIYSSGINESARFVEFCNVKSTIFEIYTNDE